MTYELVKYCHSLCELSYRNVSGLGFFKKDDLRAGVHFDGNIVFVTFRGTDNGDNALRDISILPAKTQRGYIVHQGVAKGFKTLWPAISDRLKSMPDTRIIATGHSLGGGLAILLAEQIDCEVVTFGSLKVYYRFGGTPTLKHTRIIRDDDPVPNLPGLMFKHDCEPVVIKDSDHELTSLEDHSIAGYLPQEGDWK